jgi:hypothetical protein
MRNRVHLEVDDSLVGADNRVLEATVDAKSVPKPCGFASVIRIASWLVLAPR